jgi:hypothetical protein
MSRVQRAKRRGGRAVVVAMPTPFATPTPLPPWPPLAWAAAASMETPLSVKLTLSGMNAAISAIALLR